VVLGVRGEGFERLQQALVKRIEGTEAGVMLYERLGQAYAAALERAQLNGASLLGLGPPSGGPTRARPALLATDVASFLSNPALREEMFGPSSLFVAGNDVADLVRVAEALEGQLTVTIHGTAEELLAHAPLVEVLRRKAGRLIFNGFPTGVEVGHAMQHGGPYPASTDSRSTSVGTAAITRFARPVCYQDFPEPALPAPLRNRNAQGIWRLVNGEMTRADVAPAR